MEPIKVTENKKVAEIVKDIKNDLYKRQLERKNLENKWKLNLNFVNGNQYVLSLNNGILNDVKKYYWEERKVYNHIGGLLDIRQSKLCSNKPSISVVPASGDSQDMATARTCQSICQALWYKNKLSSLVTKAISWSECCGTAFYKVTWNAESGDLLLNENGKEVYSGDVKIDVVSPFEIYPQSISFENLEDNESIIQARAYTTTKIKDMFGIDVVGEDIDVYNLNVNDKLKSFHLENSGTVNAMADKFAMVIEKYVLPTKQFPEGKLYIVCGDYLCYEGSLPYINATHKKRGYPFIKQVSFPISGSFFGSSIVERVIPLQQDYNALKNRKMEFLNRLSMGVVVAEEGAVDVDNLEDEGLEPGKVIVYRQGANPPTFMSTSQVPIDFTREETLIQNEFNAISGVSDLLKQTNYNINNLSGTALQLIIEQENSRLGVSSESINNAVCEIASQVLRLYKQFATFPRILKLVGEKGVVDAICFSSKDITSDEVVINSQYEAVTTVAQRRSMVYELLSSGILADENGKIPNTTRQKIIDMLGLGVYDMGNDETSLQIKYAQKENICFCDGVKNIQVQEIDDHKMHIKEHTCLLLGAEGEKLRKNNMYDKVIQHIREHKKYLSLENSLEEV